MKQREAVTKGALIGLLAALLVAFVAGVALGADHSASDGLGAAFFIAAIVGVIWWKRWFYTRFL